MKKFLTLMGTLFLVIIFSCNKSEQLTPVSLQIDGGQKIASKNLNVLLFDKVRAAEKENHDPSHIHLFDVTYLTDGSKALIKSNLAFGLEELQEDEWIAPGSPTFSREEEIPWSYCINDGTNMTGFFLDYFVSDKLRKHPNELAAFKTWFEDVVVDWMNDNSLAPKVKSNKPGEYWRKIIGSVE